MLLSIPNFGDNRKTTKALLKRMNSAFFGYRMSRKKICYPDGKPFDLRQSGIGWAADA
jgi:hypothetical protein